MADTDFMQKKLQSYIEKEKLIKKGDKLLLALSGGADSVALLYLLYKMRTDMNLSLLAVHVNHQLRGEESTGDEAFCKELCLQLNVPIIIRRIEISSHKDLENQARIHRVGIFTQLLKLYRFDKIVTAHHKNDQAETMLMNLMRGAGLGGLAGIKPISGNTIHPLLPFSREELCKMLQSEKITWREDSSNSDNRFARNRIRNILIPMIQSEFNPAFVEVMSRQAEIFRNSESCISNLIGRKLKKVVLDQFPDSYILSIEHLMAMTETERFYILRYVYAQLAKTENDFFYHSFDEINQLCQSDGSKETSLQHGVVVRKQYTELIFS
ncbi:MAG: tRNA lysidine(34) synthetase TilS, partial [Candidatus Cloacimonadaceae bacterium]|nr:tRNA lysidine(34) synthetase TilS [Candidatus Cloacimonadaceae bacterium]